MNLRFDAPASAAARAAVILGLLLAGGSARSPAAAQGGSPAPDTSAVTILDSVYTAEQAERGRRSFARDCSICHAPSQFGDGTLLRSWAGVTVHDLVERIRSTMPYDSPGSLSRQQYADLVAYFLELSGLPAGDEPLRAGARLRRIRIVAPPETTTPPEKP